jgi:hypothetical protein
VPSERNSGSHPTLRVLVAIRTFTRGTALALVIALGGLGTAAHAAPIAGTPPVIPVVPVCSAGALGATYTMVFGTNATGHVEYILTVTNRSQLPCALTAPMTLTLLGAGGRPLRTHPVYSPTSAGRPVLESGQWAQATSLLSPDVPGPGEPVHGGCEPVARALQIMLAGASLRAPMDPTPVCQGGEIMFNPLLAVAPTPVCSSASLIAAFRRQTAPYDGFAGYDLTLRNRSPAACHVSSVVGLRLRDTRGRRLRTRVVSGISSPYVIPAHGTETAFARVATRGGSCGRAAARVTATPIAGTAVTTAVRPPVAVCRRGLIQLSTLFLNG